MNAHQAVALFKSDIQIVDAIVRHRRIIRHMRTVNSDAMFAENFMQSNRWRENDC